MTDYWTLPRPGEVWMHNEIGRTSAIIPAGVDCDCGYTAQHPQRVRRIGMSAAGVSLEECDVTRFLVGTDEVRAISETTIPCALFSEGTFDNYLVLNLVLPTCAPGVHLTLAVRNNSLRAGVVTVRFFGDVVR